MNKIDAANWTRMQLVDFYAKTWDCPVIPMKEVMVKGKPEKRPMIKWSKYQDEKVRPTQEDYRSWFTPPYAGIPEWAIKDGSPRAPWGLAIVHQHNLFSLDLDTPEVYEYLKKQGAFPRGACIWKTRKGYHVLMKSDIVPYTIKEGQLKDINPLFNELGIGGENNSLSIMPDTPDRGWIELYDAEPVTVKYEKWLQQYLGWSKRPLKRISDYNTPVNEWVKEALKGVNEGERDNTCVKLAAHYRALGWPIEATVAYLKAEYASKCKPPFDDVEKCVRSAYNYTEKTIQTEGKQEVIDFTPVPWDKVKSKVGSTINPPLIAGLLPSGENAKLVIFGAPKTGRTTLGLCICVPLSKGEPALKKLVSLRPLKIAYGNPEQSADDLADQMMRMSPMYGLPPPDMFQLLPLCQALPNGDMLRVKLNRLEHSAPLLKQLIAGKFDLFFLDSINFGIDDNIDDDQVKATVAFLSDVLDKAHCALIITDHTKESGEALRPGEDPQPLGKLGHELKRWAGSLMYYADIRDSASDLYGHIWGTIRSGIGKVDYAVAYTKVSDSVQIVPFSSVPLVLDEKSAEIHSIRKSERVRGFQDLVIFAEGLGYTHGKIAKAVGISEAMASYILHGTKEPGDATWLAIQQVTDLLKKGERLSEPKDDNDAGADNYKFNDT